MADNAKWEPELQSYLNRACDLLEVPGAATIVVTPEAGATILTHGARCVGGEEPVTPRTAFGIASLTKAFTATAAAGLVGDGSVDWDTTAVELIPELELGDPLVSERVTLRDLLAHRAGLGSHDLLYLNIDAAPAWLLPRLVLLEPAGEFRDRFFYSSLGYALAGEMIGRAAGSSWNEVVSRRLLEPLEMTSTTVGPPPGAAAETACGHLHWRSSLTDIEPLTLAVGAPGNGLYTTADDFTRWLELLLGRGEVGGRQIIESNVLRETWAAQVAIRGSGPELRAYGLGWYLASWRGRRQMFHQGGGVGFTSQVRVFLDDGVAIAVLANRLASALPDVVAERACELLLEGEAGADLLDQAVEMTARVEMLHAAPGEALRASADPGAPPSLAASAYAGCYSNSIIGRLEVRAEDNVFGASFHAVNLVVEHLHDDVFMLSSPYLGDLSASFKVSEGVVSSVSVHLDSEERIFTRGVGSCAPVSAESEHSNFDEHGGSDLDG